MANGYKEVLFTRGDGQSDDSDIWDDTALIKAYDKAVASFKNALKGVEDSGPTKDDKLGKKRKNNKKNRNRKRSNALPERDWQIGDTCYAFWSEDGNLYPARISSIDPEKGTCIVVYTDYGNEEKQNLTDLLSENSVANSEAHRVTQVKDVQSSTDESDRSSSQPQLSQQHKSKTRPGASSGPSAWASGFSHSPSPAPAFRKVGRTEDLDPAFLSGLPFIPSGPPMIPPPPPISPDTLEDEALSSMLISWYMSGYHTGYYLGLKQAQKDIASGKSSQHK
uniref:Survival of motor neuron 1, telomeric n=1 Tax=Paramormyrops kingsleyae TaxID=1676925 RepID=A0A3B3SHI2_9TELE